MARQPERPEYAPANAQWSIFGFPYVVEADADDDQDDPDPPEPTFGERLAEGFRLLGESEDP